MYEAASPVLSTQPKSEIIFFFAMGSVEMIQPPHVVIFPFMAQGHTLPLLDLSKVLSKRSIKVTIITTPSNSPTISQYTANHPSITLTTIPFPPIHGLPEGCENTTQLPSMDFFTPFVEATKQLQQPFEQILQKMSGAQNLPICVISDFFLAWTLESSHLFGVPRLVFHGMGVASMAIARSAFTELVKLGSNKKKIPDSIIIPNLEMDLEVAVSDLPTMGSPLNPNDPFAPFLIEMADAEARSWGIVANTFLELDGSYVQALESFYKDGARAWCVGPLFLHDNSLCCSAFLNEQHQHSIDKWLEKQLPASVLYVSFGTQADVSDAQLDELAHGLGDSGQPFLWVIRSNTWCLPKEVEEKVKGKGLIVRKWVDQRSILEHESVGGILSHCGWNSVLESLSAGVPILGWPLIADQALNAKFVADGLGAGIRIEAAAGKETVMGVAVLRTAVCDGVKELMREKKGGMARGRAKELGEAAKRAVEDGGSSYCALSQLIELLSANKLK